MKLTVENFDLLTSNKYPTLCLRRQNEYGGVKKLTFEDIDTLRKDRYSDAITILGLQQDTFEYFIEKYASQFKIIRFYNCRAVQDWTSLGKLKGLEFLELSSNHGLTSLWDLSGNHSLQALSINSCSKMHNIEGIEKAPALRRFDFGDALWRTTTIDSFMPLSGTKIEYLEFNGKKVEDNDLSFLWKMPELKHFDFPTNLFTTEQIAWIVANFPNVEGYALRAKIDTTTCNNAPATLIIGKRKPCLLNMSNEDKIQRYVDQFNRLVEYYKGKEI